MVRVVPKDWLYHKTKASFLLAALLVPGWHAALWHAAPAESAVKKKNGAGKEPG